MVRAAATGAIDFAQADPRDKYWWRRLRWITDTIAREDDYRLTEAQHRHWVTVFANGQLNDESFENAKSNAQEYLNRLVIHRYPEYEQQLQNEAYLQTREGALAAWREQFGYPGEPRYEKMLEDAMSAFKRLAEEYKDHDYGDDAHLWTKQ